MEGSMKHPRSDESKGRKILADTMTSGEMAAHRARNGIVLLPVGCFEMHGPLVGMSCDSFLAEAACRVVAEEWDAIIMPTIHYTYPGATGTWPGTVCVLPRDALDYAVAVTKAIVLNGFKRLVLVSLHGPNDFVLSATIRTIFEETGQMPILFIPAYEEFCLRVEQEMGQPHAEAAGYLASLYICGRHGDFDPATEEGEAIPRTTPFESLRQLSRHGVRTPYRYVRPQDHVGRLAGMTLDDAPRLAELYREAILERAKGLPEDYEKFQADTWQAVKDAPWDTWFK